jgi:predicted transcriptional regulator
LKSIGAPKGSRIPVNVSIWVNKLSVSELAALTKLSKSCISQVKNGKRNPSQKLIQAILYDCKPNKQGKDVTTLPQLLNYS